MYSICAVLLLIAAVDLGNAEGDSTSGRDLPLSDVKFIETVLANISAQLAAFKFGKSLADVGESLTSVTSLLQLSLLREVLTEYRVDSSTSDAMEAIATLSRMEELLNGSIINQQTILMDVKKQGNANGQAISSLQKQVTSTLNNIKTNLQLLVQQNLTKGHIYPSSKVLHSCEEIKTNWPDSPSDYYTIADSNGHTRQVYCHMEELCGSDEGWMRVAYLNMADPNEKCPEELRLYEENEVRACCRPSTSLGSCISTTYPSKDISYSQVCGKIIGYQFGSPDGTNNNNIDTAYIDGISLTHGSPRRHIWSFIGAAQENVRYDFCPCGTINKESPPSFVGDDYFCESGAPSPWQSKLYTDDPLWDGEKCGDLETQCCGLPGIPWFHKTLEYTTTDYIEMRVCCDQATNDEDMLFSFVELYIK